ncbi:UNVERIFIED_CONTAM: hypothetical protein GTU68_055612 [Idotea baltica]|nr:hypothetical protein [Idotea baltica]
MAAKGWQIAFAYRSDIEAARATVQEIEALGARAKAIQCDVAEEADVLKAFDTTVEYFGSLDFVVINAGIVGPSLCLAEMTQERLKRMFDVNVLGSFLFAREAARRLPTAKNAETGAIVLVSSAAARLGSPFEYVDYAASKGALDTLTIGLSKELAPQSIRVNGVRPGLVETQIHASGGQPDRAQRLGQNVPMERPGSAEEVGRAIVWLCSDEASYCTGSILDVAGGR